MWVDASIYIPHLSGDGEIFFVEFANCVGFPSPCHSFVMLRFTGFRHYSHWWFPSCWSCCRVTVHFNFFVSVSFLMLLLRLAFFPCTELAILFYFHLLVRRCYLDRNFFGASKILVAIPEQMCCVCPIRLCGFFSALFAFECYGWPSISNHHAIKWSPERLPELRCLS